MTTDTQIISTKNSQKDSIESMENKPSKLEERKGNALKPLSMRPNRSMKKTNSLKPLGFKAK